MAKPVRPPARLIPMLGIDARFLAYLRPHGALLAASVLLILLVAALETLAPWPVKFIIDHVIGAHPAKAGVELTALDALHNLVGQDPRVLTAVLGAGLLALTVLQGLAGFGFEYLNSVIQEKTTFQLRSDVFSHVQRLPLEFYDQGRMGDLVKRMTDDTGKVMAALISNLGEVLVNAVKFANFAAVMLLINWRFSVIVLAYAPLLLFLFVGFRRTIRSVSKDARTQEGLMHNHALETLGAIRIVKAFGREDYQRERYDAHSQDRAKAGVRTARWEASFSPVVDFIEAASTAAVIWYGVSQVLIGLLSVGELILFLAYLGSIYKPLKKFGSLAGDLQKAAASGDRLSELLDADVRIASRPDAIRMQSARGDLRFENVDFAYAPALDQLVLENISFRVNPGQSVALVGATGAGKSTISSLLLRLYDVTSGRILLDGHDLRDVELDDLRAQFAYVPQEALLFAASIYDNIAYGRPGASEADVMAAARAANAEEFILRMPQGYRTVVGERGATLSGGQRQRIAIARAVLRDAPVLILDEPTSALDAASEDLVMSALERLRQGRTAVIIAHRLSTIRDVDRIIVLEHGRVLEEGTYDGLIARGGAFARLAQLQLGDGAALNHAVAAQE